MRKIVSSQLGFLAAIFATIFFLLFGAVFQAEEDGGSIYDRQESCLHLSLIPDEDTELSPGDGAQRIEVTAEWHSWEIWIDPATGEEEHQNASTTPAEGAVVNLQLRSGLGVLSASSVTTDSDGRAEVYFTPQSSGIDTVDAAAGDSTASLDFTISDGAGAGGMEEMWEYSHTEATLSAEFSLANDVTALYEGETRMLLLTVHYETWDVLTNGVGETRIENLTRSPADGASIDWYAESGDAFVTGYGTADTAGFAQGSITVGSAESIARVDISYATGQSTSATLTCSPELSGGYSDPYSYDPSTDPYSDPYAGYDPSTDPAYYDTDPGSDPTYDPTTDPSYSDPYPDDPSYTDPSYPSEYWSHSETVYSITNLAADGPTELMPGETRLITGQLLAEEWDVWNVGGAEDFRFNWSYPATWGEINLEYVGTDGTQPGGMISTDGEGWFSTTFAMGSAGETIRFLDPGSGGILAEVPFTLVPGGVEPEPDSDSGTVPIEGDDWTYLRAEGRYAIQDLSVDGATYDVSPGTTKNHYRRDSLGAVGGLGRRGGEHRNAQRVERADEPHYFTGGAGAGGRRGFDSCFSF